MNLGAAPLDLLPDPRRQLLLLLKERGPLAADEAARALQVTVSAARQQLAILESGGLVLHRREAGGPGRPRHLFSLTPAGDSLFPRRNAELARELLGYLEDEAPDLLERVFTLRARRRIDQARIRLEGLDLETRVSELATILDEDGYLTRVEPLDDGGFLLVEGNCAVLDVAQRYGGACSSEIDFLRQVLPDAEVQRVSHIVRGDRTCAYRIHPHPFRSQEETP
jgi:DeoR family transcriptional regulator, suf operon transcriptional repressor